MKNYLNNNTPGSGASLYVVWNKHLKLEKDVFKNRPLYNSKPLIKLNTLI